MATFFPCSLRPPNSSLHSSHHVFTKVTWEWHGMTSSSSPFSSYHRTNSVTAHRQQHLCICALRLVADWSKAHNQTPPTWSPWAIRPDVRTRSVIRSPRGPRNRLMSKIEPPTAIDAQIVQSFPMRGMMGPKPHGSTTIRVAPGSTTRSTVLIKHQWVHHGPTIQTVVPDPRQSVSGTLFRLGSASCLMGVPFESNSNQPPNLSGSWLQSRRCKMGFLKISKLQFVVTATLTRRINKINQITPNLRSHHKSK